MKLKEAIKRVKDIHYYVVNVCNDISLDEEDIEAIDTVVKEVEKPLPCERCKKLEYMIENGLGWKDMENDISPMHEL